MNQSRSRIAHHPWCEEDRYAEAYRRYQIQTDNLKPIEALRTLLKALLEKEISTRKHVNPAVSGTLACLPSLSEEQLRMQIEPYLYQQQVDLYEPKKRNRKPEAFVERHGRIWQEMRAQGVNASDAAKAVGRKFEDNYSNYKTRRSVYYRELKDVHALELTRYGTRRQKLDALFVKYSDDPNAIKAIQENIFYGARYIDAHEIGDAESIERLGHLVDKGFDHPWWSPQKVDSG